MTGACRGSPHRQPRIRSTVALLVRTKTYGTKNLSTFPIHVPGLFYPDSPSRVLTKAVTAHVHSYQYYSDHEDQGRHSICTPPHLPHLPTKTLMSSYKHPEQPSHPNKSSDLERLTDRSFAAHERTSFITTTLSDPDAFENVRSLSGGDAQAFVDVMDEVSP